MVSLDRSGAGVVPARACANGACLVRRTGIRVLTAFRRLMRL